MFPPDTSQVSPYTTVYEGVVVSKKLVENVHHEKTVYGFHIFLH